MPNSMTGYGIDIYSDEHNKVVVEIKSVNSRYLEIVCKLPKAITYLEDSIRNTVSEKIKRGRVDVIVQLENYSINESYHIDKNKIIEYKKIFDDIQMQTGIQNNMQMSDYITLPDIITKKEEKDDNKDNLIKSSLKKAIDELVIMRKNEGKKIVEDMINRTILLEKNINELENYTQDMINILFEKLRKKVNELTQSLDVVADDGKIIEQAAIYADKMSVTEEIVRFKSHISQLRQFLSVDIEIGKKIDFLLQEMNREINTIGSKSQKKEIVSLVVEIKSQLEKIREQVQNIE